jgi:alkylation response protein AidB-like acyl-CoA dehydrogenase
MLESRLQGRWRLVGSSSWGERKWWTSGAGDPRCEILIFMGKTDPAARLHSR